MPTSDSLRAEIARLSGKEADLHRELARYEADANKHRSESNKKAEAAGRTKSDSMRRSYSRASDVASKKAADAERKAADVKRKIADAQKRKAAKEKSLTATEQSNRRIEERELERARKKEKAHARELARISAPTMRLVHVTPPKPEPLRVLYLTANPEATESVETNPDGSTTSIGVWLRTEAEVRNVKKELRGAAFRDRIEVHHLPAATYEDMLEGINDVRPHIVHFSGHGGAGGILLDNGSVGAPEGVDMAYDALGAFLSATDEPPKLLVLNACDTLDGVEALLPAVPVVIAMSDVISDAAASMFATKFYAAIASAQSVESALKQARAVLMMLPSSEAHLPEHVARDGIDIGELVLVERDPQ